MRAGRIGLVLISLGIQAGCGGGSSSQTPTAAPSNLTYSTNPAVYTKGAAIASNTPTSSGGAVVSYAVLPALPAGLNLDTSTGVISGAPTAVTAQATYTVTATNSGGGTSRGLVITVNDVAPSNLTYSTNPAVYTKGAAIASNTPTSSGGAVVSYSVLPALPAGLSLDTSSGVISGTPTAVTAQATYTVTATNSGGFTTGDLVITVNDVAPSSLAYSTNPAVYTKGAAIAANTPTSSRGVVVSYSVLPALPAGLNLDTTSGVISGTPTAITPQATYTVTATNSGGFTTGDLVITVNDVAPSSLAYSTNPAVYTKGAAIASNTPTSSGGAVASYAVLPALPTGLSLDTGTGAIWGTPTAIAAQNTYTVTATNSGGLTTGDLVITVNDVAPSNLEYSTNPAVYTKGVAIAANTPTSSGGAVVSYSVLPALPAGLNLDTRTGVLSGTPTVITAQTTYTVTASNSGGSTATGLTVTVDSLPPRFAYVANSGDNTVSIFTVDAVSGRLRANGYVVAGTYPYSVIVDPLGKFAYVANAGSNNVSAYTINPSTGALTSVGSPVAAGTNPASVTVDPTGRFAYVANSGSNDVSAYTIDASTGALTSVGSPVAVGAIPFSVSVDPTGRFVYVANRISSTVSAYTIDVATGALTSVGSPVSAGTGPFSVTVDPSGRFAYVANSGSRNVSAYSINASTGELTSLGSPVAAGSYPYSVTVDPSGRFAYVANLESNNVSAYTIDASTGELTSLGSPVAAGSYPNSVTVDPSGKFAYVANIGSHDVSAYTIDASTGTLTRVGTISARSGASSIAVAQGATPVTYVPKFAYVANVNSNSVSTYTINASTGTLTSVGSTGVAYPYSVTVDPSGRFAYVANAGSNNVAAYTINASTGTLTSVGSPVAAGTQPLSVTVDPSGKFAYAANFVSNNVSAYTINASTGALTSVGSPVAAGTSPNCVTVDPLGKFAYVANTGSSNVSAYTINASTGALTGVGSLAAGAGPRSVTVDPSGKFAYVANQSSGNVSAYTINVSTGALTSVGSPVTAGSGPYSVTVDPSGRFAYVANLYSNDVSAYTINASTGALTSVGSPVAAGSGPASVTADPSGEFIYVANVSSNDVSVYTINASTGALTGVGSPVAAGSAPISVTVAGSIQ